MPVATAGAGATTARSNPQPHLFPLAPNPFPDWLPTPVRLYLSHTEAGVSLRVLARAAGVNASTVLRQIRRYEIRREDPLMDGALNALRPRIGPDAPCQKDAALMTFPHTPPNVQTRMVPPGPEAGALTGSLAGTLPDEDELGREARRLLRRLSEPGAVLAFAPDMEKAVILRESADGRSTRTAILERRVAQAFSLKNWIVCRKQGRVSTYEITAAGRAMLRHLLQEEAMARQISPAQWSGAERAGPENRGFAECQSTFLGARHDGDTLSWPEEGLAAARRGRIHVSESPVAVLGRRLDREGKPFLDSGLVQAAERLREDFELARFSPALPQSWDRIVASHTAPDGSPILAPDRAKGRVVAALSDLGPGLGDVALRVCCFLEGVESAERRMGWAARSGKIVLRIALQRLRRHYDESYGRSGPLIG